MKVNNEIITRALIAIKDNDKDKLMDILFEYQFVADINTEGFEVAFNNKNKITLYEFFGILAQEVKKIGDKTTSS